MTDSRAVLTEKVYDSFSALRSSVDALICAADLIPDGGEEQSMGRLFRLLAYHLDADLAAHFRMLCSG